MTESRSGQSERSRTRSHLVVRRLAAAMLAVLLLAQLGARPGIVAAAKRGDVAEHVVVISIDGLRPDAIAKYHPATIERLMRDGSYSLKARTILQSETLPSHTSMLTGVEPQVHGITWNSDQMDAHGHVDVPTVFGLAKRAGFRTAAFFSKPKFHHLEAPATLDYVRSPRGGLLDSKWAATHTVSLVEEYLRTAADAPNLLFVHIGEPDYAGHLFGWMGFVYGRAVREADRAVGEILRAADARFGSGNYSVIVTADHGGHDRTHGTSDSVDTTIPWLAWGRGVRAGIALDTEIRTMDTAATAMWLLGVEVPDSWMGRAVESAYVAGIETGAGSAMR